MEDNAKNASSYHLDQEILDERGIDMTVEEVAGLSTCKYSERVKTLKLTEDDLAFLKGLRRRIKNRLASQNSRRRSVEQLRRLTRELRAVRACRDDALAERRALVQQRDSASQRCSALREFLIKTLSERNDPTEVPSVQTPESQPTEKRKKPAKTIPPPLERYKEPTLERDKDIFECRLDKLVENSVQHLIKSKADTLRDRSVDIFMDESRRVYAKTVFITNRGDDVNSVVLSAYHGDSVRVFDEGVLNLSVRDGGRKAHGRKQSAPRRIAYAFADCEDAVLDLKIKNEDK